MLDEVKLARFFEQLNIAIAGGMVTARVAIQKNSKEFDMDTASYPAPIDKLLSYGDAGEVGENPKDWSQYLELGLGPEHIPDLIRMATDEELRWAESNSLEVWAPIHAWRALGALRAEAAIEPLLSLFKDIEENDDEWAMEELPEVYGMIGPAAIPALERYIDDTSHPTWPRVTARQCLEEIAKRHPESRDDCVAILTRQLERFEENDDELNAFLISSLVHLKALEAAPVMEQAFAADRVETFIMGDWDDVQVELGLKSEEEVREQRRSQAVASNVLSNISAEVPTSVPSSSYYRQTSQRSRADHKKSKIKMAKHSRKKNR